MRCSLHGLLWIALASLALACGGGTKTAPKPRATKPGDAGREPGAASDAASVSDADTGSPDAASTEPDAGGLHADAGAPGAKPDSGMAKEPTLPPLAASCENGLHDGSETDIDCGGGECGACLSGRNCMAGSDCVSGQCKSGSCTCVPLKTCPDKACGTLHECGESLDCGSCASGVCYENQCCTPRSCAAGECGVFADGCGGTVRCGDQSCCTPRTCDHPSLANRCGAFDDRCGGSVQCSCTDASAVCYLGDCCKPHACDGDVCGSILADGCGGAQSCSCASGKTCYMGHCCAPRDCSAWTGPGCSQLDDGCGGTIDCGCAGGQRCYEGSCCTKTACGAGVDGDACGTAVSDGCGGTQSCVCSGGLPCYLNKCCAAKSCSQQGLAERCGSFTDGCGQSLWCGCGVSPGIHVAERANCGHACADTLDKLRACTSGAALETLDQTAGWDFPQSLSSSPCNANYGFSPSFTTCPSSSSAGFQLDAQGFIFLDVGTQCFSITGRKLRSCGALYVWTTPDSFAGWDAAPGSTAATLVSGQTPVCFDITKSDYYPIRWHYTQDAALEDFHVNYCAGGTSSCTPIAPGMLRPALP